MIILCLLAALGVLVIYGGAQMFVVAWPILLIALGVKGIIDKLS